MALLHTRLGLWLAAMVLLMVALAALGATGAVAPLEDAATGLFGPVQRALRRAAEPIANLIRNVDDFDALDEENRALRGRIEQLEAEGVRLREEQVQIRGRAALQEIQAAQPAETFLAADVVTRDLTGLRDILSIDKGTDDGVQEGMPVLAAGGSLAGVVMEARTNRAFVRLITDPDSSVRALHQLTRSEGIVNGDTSGSLRVAFIPQATDVQPGHTFVTSGLGGLLPKGIPVGTVASAEGAAQEVFKRIRLRPIAPLEQLETVLVQVSFVPQPAPAPASAGAGPEDGDAPSESGP